MTRSCTTPRIGRPSASKNRQQVSPTGPAARNALRSAGVSPSPSTISLLDPVPTVPMPTMAMSAVTRPRQHLADRRLGQQGVPRRLRPQQSRGVEVPVGRSRGARRARAPAPGRRRATPPSSSRRPAERPPRCAADPPRPPRPWPAATFPRTAPAPAPSRSDSSSHWAARSPAAARTSAPGRKAATRTCASPKCSRSACSSSPARAVWSCTRISTMPCARAADSIRDTFDRLVPERARDVVLRPAVQEVHPGGLDQRQLDHAEQASSHRSLSITDVNMDSSEPRYASVAQM